MSDTEYIIYIQTDFGELKVYFETEELLKNEEEVLSVAMDKLDKSKDIELTGLIHHHPLYYEVTEGRTQEDL